MTACMQVEFTICPFLFVSVSVLILFLVVEHHKGSCVYQVCTVYVNRSRRDSTPTGIKESLNVSSFHAFRDDGAIYTHIYMGNFVHVLRIVEYERFILLLNLHYNFLLVY